MIYDSSIYVCNGLVYAMYESFCSILFAPWVSLASYPYVRVGRTSLLVNADLLLYLLFFTIAFSSRLCA